MTTTTVLAAGTTAADSTDVSVAAGASVTIAMFVTAGGLGDAALTVLLDTPGEDVPVHRLDSNVPAVALSGPGTYRLRRDESTVSVGAISVA